MKLYRERRDILRDDKSIYLRRWYVFDTPWFGLKLHKILLSDHDCVHNHPWDFYSLILKGGYVEHTEKQISDPMSDGVHDPVIHIVKSSKIFHPGQILFRKAEHRHKLEIHQPCWTLVLTLKRRRRWGFWTRLGWVHWKNFQSTQSCD